MPDALGRDPLTWSLNLGRWMGIQVRVHIIFLIFVVCELIQAALPPGGLLALRIVAAIELILFVSVLLHEFGHCFAARAVGGSADEILMWPLGGLAYVSVPNLPRSHFITAAAGPAVTATICLICAALLVPFGVLPPLNPLHPTTIYMLDGSALYWGSGWPFWVGVTFGVNWVLLLFNLVPAFPLDGGRMFRAILWSRLDFARGTLIAVQVAKVVAIGMFVLGIINANFSLIGVAVFVYLMSEMERRMIEASLAMDESVFGYDFSQGYTSLERNEPRPRARPMSAWERWRKRRERIRQQRALQSRAEEEQRVDEILRKLHESGMDSLSDAERRFLRDASQKYRSRNEARD